MRYYTYDSDKGTAATYCQWTDMNIEEMSDDIKKTFDFTNMFITFVKELTKNEFLSCVKIMKDKGDIRWR